MTFSVIAFATTLYNRKVVGVWGMSMCFLSSLLTLFVTVASMEYHVPFVSVQRLYLPCPVHTERQSMLMEALDLSTSMQNLLRWLGFTVVAPPEGEYQIYQPAEVQ